MDIRITNTCNSNCLYCLEGSLRKKKKFKDKKGIYSLLEENKGDRVVNFYGGNPLLHPDLISIVRSCKQKGFESRGLLTNTFNLTDKYLEELVSVGLNNIGFYFHSFDREVHDRITNGGITLRQLLKNIFLIQKTGIFCKAVIHVNKQNVDLLEQNIVYLYKKFHIKSFDIINYLPKGRALRKYNDLLEYQIKKEALNRIKRTLQCLGLQAHFIRF